MTNWEQWEGRTVDEEYVLRKYLGGSEGRAVFQTGPAEGRADAVIKFIAADDSEGRAQQQCWETASKLVHPNLIRILAAGRTNVDGQEFFYAVEDYAEENLAQVLPARALTMQEARGTLEPLMEALEYLHGEGLVHGDVRPSNIRAIGNEIKLSTDSLNHSGDVPRQASLYDAPEVGARGVSVGSDVWSLGMTLAESMTQRAPTWDAARMHGPEIHEGVPEPIRSIVRGCLEIDPEKRWGLREIRERLKGDFVPATTAADAEVNPRPPSLVEKRSAAPYWIAGIAALAVVVLLLAHPWQRNQQQANQPEPGSVSVQSQAGPAKSESAQRAAPLVETARPNPAVPVAAVTGHRVEKSSGEGKPEGSEESQAARQGNREGAADDVVERVMPQVLPSARRTIEGRIRVRVKVDVGADGNVSEARLTDAGPSKYFARVALEAARGWKFAPAREQDQKREWNLMFFFTRARTEMAAAKVRGD